MTRFFPLLLCGLSACGPASAATFELHSERVGDTYDISVWSPPGFDSSIEALPVVVQLDGEYQGQFVADQASALGLRVIVVGVAGGSSKKRLRDYTPTEDARFGADTGGGRAFFDFLTSELLPRVERDFGASPSQRTLMGHSLGGLAVLEQFLDQRAREVTFTNFAAASPSLWWDSGTTLARERASTAAAPRGRLFLSAASLESADIVLYTRAFAERAHEAAYQDVEVRAETYADSGHTWSYERAYRDALEFFRE